MINIFTTLLHGLLICIPFSLFAIISFWLKPRLWLHSLPLDIQQKATPKTELEKKQTKFILLPLFFIILPGLSILSTLYIVNEIKVDISLFIIFWHLYGIWLIVHIWDFLVIDGLHIFFIDIKHPPIPGTENLKGWADYGFHFQSPLKACYMSLIFVLPVSVVFFLLQ